ncbi:MAG: carboxylating nicotinate-nucleotide diphosphorylase [Chitinophagaceae bacterium]|nr:carboxylating nicotinate-nucleotide diphosphorylase [Chitinophagaceae bacterium]HQV05531.1 carboxylating nicotinate-nucleotide diphosphorylase [Chitinophagaceae bacterium]
MHFDTQFTHFIEAAFKEDVGDGDHSTLSVIDPNAVGKAMLKIKQEGMMAGMQVAEKIFQFREPAVKFTPLKKDGEWMKAGETAFTVEAKVHTILQCERLVLNCMQRMCGIATLTHQYVAQLKGTTTKLLDTRKTTPNFRLLEKEAVRIGGGVNHRFGLFDMIMLKDNHIDYAGGIEKAIQAATDYVQTKKPDLKIEVETRTLDDVKKVLAVNSSKVFRIMLDNFSPAEVKKAVKLIEHKYETEASGGINLENIVDYAHAGVDYVSVGALIHQARSLDLSLKAMK